MSNVSDNYPDPITLLFIKLDYEAVAKVLFEDYTGIDESIRATACLEFLKHFFYNTSPLDIELFKKKNPQAGMIFDILDGKTEQLQRDARHSANQKYYHDDPTIEVGDILKKLAEEGKEKRKERNKRYQEKLKQKKQQKEVNPDEEFQEEMKKAFEAVDNLDKRKNC